VLCDDELRVFDRNDDDPEDPRFILRVVQDEAPVPVTALKFKGEKACFSFDDCGSRWIFHAVQPEQQARWIAIISGKLPTSPTKSLSKDLHTLRLSLPSPSPMMPEFKSAFPAARHHGYVLIQNSENKEWLQQYLVLVSARHVNVYNSQTDAPSSVEGQFDIDVVAVHAMLDDGSRLPTEGDEACCFPIRVSGQVPFQLCARDKNERDGWMKAILGERYGKPFVSVKDTFPSAESSRPPSSSSASPASAASASSIPFFLLPFVSHFGHIDYWGWLSRKKRFKFGWSREFFVLVGPELHYYLSTSMSPSVPKGTAYICTNSGKPFPVVKSSKRPHCFSIQNPGKTHYMSADTHKEMELWLASLKENQSKVMNKAASPSPKTPGPPH